ncbi:uncharacterized protein CTHT_0012650 [Thermochaetoides thermophila DSM 1495]|uniref:Uncharacterized protein n=1 Tax=Chaetomium thermophilum (strain DSM 1495 / CBS 144.50 / IMI 039719) TaxID=759272 RepID=G0S180_CHATD|nr:hypothetical protein CTHT_0012650 [Thermochaetoides thermophila DSM 1495]EGS22790.1 hypothetical protein CTHT_0012650 [Thermochaetoides thermophila DSM 1495]
MSTSLDDEIEALQARVNTLKSHLRIHTSTLLTAPSTLSLITSDRQLQSQSSLQQAHTQQCLYRACASITTFRTRDPDPRAVDSGSLLGLRIEVVSRGKFLRPYYVILNRPWRGHRHHLRVHRHTLPACVSVGGLAARYLPAPIGGDQDEDGEGEKGKKQDLARFARALRREVVRYHNRLGVVADLRRAAELAGKKNQEDDEKGEEQQRKRENMRLVDIRPADVEAKQIAIEWEDGRTGRLVMDDDGEIVKLVIVGENGRDHEAKRDLLGGARRVEDVVKRLAAIS